ncbi:unnamed protein product [Prorocentrum cordatum]|uniref:Calmodulin n=1 Tax=Prorocentrum cordatum TaxID=2364126 RepID=A0ABN9TRT7_9DINO|nr:unnamed protein product [Polarella glacialis]
MRDAARCLREELGLQDLSDLEVGPRLKVSVPNFRRTDFSGEIDRLGGLGSARRASAATSGQLGQLSTSALSARCAPSAPGAAAGRAYPSSPKVQSARGPLRAPAASSEEEEPQLAGPALEEWLKFIRTPRATDEASAAPASSRPAPGAAGAAEAGAELPDLVGAPLETFDSAEDFEVRSPEEWIELCRQTAAKPQACVLQFVSLEWTMSACWVHSYDAQSKRYLVELEDGLQKRVKRLALRFNAEDPANFARRVETCRAKKAHCELQQAFIAFIQGQSDDLVSPMKREHKEQFIRQCLHKSHVDEAINYVTTIRKLILEIEQNYVLSTKFAKVKADFTGRGSSRADSPFAALLQSFQPPPAPALGLVPHEEAELPVPSLVDHFSRLPTLSTVFTSVTLSVWTRFLDEVSRHRVLDTTRCGRAGARASTPRLLRGTVPDPDATVFEPDSFFRHMEDYRRDVAVTLERHWRDYIVSEVLDKMAEGSNFFVDNSQKHLRMPLHRILRKFDLILSSQMREFISRSLEEWVDFVRSFVPNPSQTLPVPLLRIRLTATSDEVVVLPAPSELIAKLLELIDDVTKVTDVLATTEPELVPFCSLPGGLLFELRGGDQQLERAKAATEEVVRHCLLAVQEVQAQYQEYAHLLQEEVEFLDPLEVEDVRERAARYVQAGTAIEKLTAPILRFPLFEVSCQEAIQTLSQRAYHLAEACLKQVAASVQERSEAVLDEWADAQRQVLSSPEDEEELAKLKDFMANIKEAKTKPLMQTTRHIHSQIDLLSEFSFEVEPKVIEQAFTAFFWPQQIQIDVAESERSLDSQKSRFMDKLDQERKDFDADMAKYQEELLWLKELDNYSMAQKVSTRVSKLQENLQGAKERVQKFAQREKLFNMEGSDYSQLDVMLESFEPYNQLWTSAIDFRHFQEETLNVTPLNKLDAAEIEALVEDQFRESYKTIKAFEGHPKPQAVAKELRDDIMSFRKNMPVVQAVCQEAFQAMHLAALFEELDVDMDIDDGLTLQGLLQNANILNRIEIVQRISAEAQKQFSLKAALATMKREWKPVELEVIAYKESGTYVIRGTDDIQALLDDHIVKTQGIRGSPFVKPIEKEVKDWEAKLLSVQDLLEQWLMVQRSWLYLEPIFMSDDIQRQMPGESKRFEGANTLWRTTMKLAVENPNMLDISDIEGLLPGFTKANQELELIQKGLNDYLETKRLAFPRFFFLSNDELLMILSQTKDPTAVQPHMSKCFEGINSIRFDSSKTVIQAMLSVEGEVVELAKPVNVNEGDKKGNVEKWLLEVQTSMIDCLTQVTDSSIKAYATTERTKWILEWPGQVALCVDNIYWTQEVTEAIDGGSMDDYVKVSVSQLNGLVNLVRADLTKLARQTLSAVVTIDVHNRDVVMGLAAAKVHSSKEFDWIQQLRYYWRTQGSIIDRGTGKKTEVDKCEVSIINATLYYGFEYLGNSDRLVITPLTDRCYRTLMGAFHLYYGGGPEGPAGTGKTESTKDLAKAVAVQCVVFNCSDGLDYIAMAKFFKGLASSGAWCCFDEFNRINLEVLSVVSQQVQTIQFAIRDKKKVFIFEGTEIQLVPTCAVNITMNPGYAGRSELPDNLKALFRPCAMMVPDYALIGEIVLYSFGFEDAKNLARKAVGSLRLGSEQLSSQDHYDFGMRALKSILVRAGALRRLYGSTRSEEVLALSALSDVNLPKFTANDIPLFKGITGDLFPGVALPPSDYGALIEQLEGSARALTLQPKDGSAAAPFFGSEALAAVFVRVHTRPSVKARFFYSRLTLYCKRLATSRPGACWLSSLSCMLVGPKPNLLHPPSRSRFPRTSSDWRSGTRIEDACGESPPPPAFQDVLMWPNVWAKREHAFPQPLWKPFGEHVGVEEEDEARGRRKEDEKDEETFGDLLGSSLWPLGSFLGASWRPLGDLLGPRGASGGFLGWGPLWQSDGVPGPSDAVMSRLGGLSGPSWGPLGTLQGRLEGHLGRHGGLLDLLGPPSGPSGEPLGPFWGHLGGLLGALGAILGLPDGHVGHPDGQGE